MSFVISISTCLKLQWHDSALNWPNLVPITIAISEQVNTMSYNNNDVKWCQCSISDINRYQQTYTIAVDILTFLGPFVISVWERLWMTSSDLVTKILRRYKPGLLDHRHPWYHHPRSRVPWWLHAATPFLVDWLRASRTDFPAKDVHMQTNAYSYYILRSTGSSDVM